MHAVNFFRRPKLLMSKARLIPDFLEKLYFASVGYLAWLQDKKMTSSLKATFLL